MKILAFCFFPAFVPPSNGGQSRLFNFYSALSKWHEITLLTSSHVGGEEERVLHGADFIERRIPKDDYFIRQYAQLDSHGNGGDLSGPAIAVSGGFPTRLHQAYLEEYEKADVIIHDDPFTVAYDLFAGLDRKFRIYNSYNCETLLYQQLHPDERSHPIHDIVRQAELRMLEMSDLVLYCNEEDLAAFREMAPDADFDALYAPNGMMPLGAYKASSVRSSPGRFRTVFMGSGHPPNAQAAEFITRKLAPQLPEFDFEIIGSCLPEGRYPPNVRRHGVVSDDIKKQVLGAANLALNPMAAGSGSNVKVLDYFAHDLPVLSTAFGMRGIQAEAGRDYLEAGLEQFADALRAAASQPETLAGIAQGGKALALGQYTWDAITGNVMQAINGLVAAKAETSGQYVLALNDYDSFAGIGGGGTRTRGLYAAVSEWCPVVFVSFSDEGRLEARQHANNITVINVPKTREHLAELQTVNAQFHVSADDIIAGRHCADNPYLAAVYRALRQHARCIVMEHCYLVTLPGSWGDRFVYSSQNHEVELKRRILEWHPLRDALLRDVEYLERFAVECSAATIAVSREDAEGLMRGKRAAGPVIVVRNGAAVPAQGEAVEQAKMKLCSQIGARAAIFLGSAHMPNVEAARFITEQLALQCTDVQFHLLGSVCNAITQVPRNVKLWGVVDDETKSAVMQSCTLAINPMLSGSGSNVKLADYIGNGLHVVTTEFGQRGYPVSVREHVDLVPLDGFADAIGRVFDRPELQSGRVRKVREALFLRELSMLGLAARFVETLQGLEAGRKRVLYVAYRYVAPALGGAEIHLDKFISALGRNGKFDVDVIAPEVSTIHSHWRFGERYSFDPALGVLVDIPNVRFARFPIDAPDEAEMLARLRRAWCVQPRFERAVSDQLASLYTESGLAWGWGYPEGEAGRASRWAFAECGIHLQAPARMVVDGYVPDEVVITAYACGAMIGGPWKVNGKFQFELEIMAGEILLTTSAPVQPLDPRPLGFHVSHVLVNGIAIDLAAPMLSQRYLSAVAAETAFRMLDKAAEKTRAALGDLCLTHVRGPWSTGLERYIVDHVGEYDLVIANNNVFRPAVMAMAEAKRQGVPSILIPHAHLDDDFYHFPDWLQSARDASLVLAVPRAACDFLAEKGCNVRYLPAGCDTREEFTARDVEAFRQVYPAEGPFMLVLGRKAGAKAYRKIINAVEHLNREGQDLHVVLIGPDDDGFAVDSHSATYLGRQPRNVVRGALKSCLALCNMSSSESFGIVLLEAWLAGKPVIANKNCAAFHDMAIDHENALLVVPEQAADAIRELLTQPVLATRLAEKGKNLVERFEWDIVCSEFVDICAELAQTNTKHRERQ